MLASSSDGVNSTTEADLPLEKHLAKKLTYKVFQK